VASLTRAKVEVTDNQVEAALKTLKKVMIKGGLYQEMKRRVYYEKPSVKRKRKQAQARKKRRRALKRSRSSAFSPREICCFTSRTDTRTPARLLRSRRSRRGCTAR